MRGGATKTEALRPLRLRLYQVFRCLIADVQLTGDIEDDISVPPRNRSVKETR
jgi:hypothetical protein